jgi:3-isopropylmalate/(R)-2-methylmalate dehydratase small subunit
VQESFAFDDFRRWCLLEGMDDVALTLRHADRIAAFEATRASWLPNA